MTADIDFGERTDINYVSVSILRIQNTILLFGGSSQKRQISEVHPWKNGLTRRIGTLPFDFNRGRCISHNSIIYLCFDSAETDLCRYR